MRKGSKKRRLLSRAEAAELSGFSIRFIDRAMREGKLPHSRVGKKVVIPLKGLEAFLDGGL